jgi:sporulation protein YlmC with PRC-barrel domain
VEELLRQSVVLKGVRIGVVVDVILENENGDVVGFEVRCEDGRHRFLPQAAANRNDSTIEIDTPLALLDSEQLAYYRKRGRTLRGRG